MDDNKHLIEAFWQQYLATLPAGGTLPSMTSAWSFGDSPRLADELVGLVLAGLKTATCGALWEYEAEGEPVQQIGQLSVVLDGAGRPMCVVETAEVEIRPYNQVDAQFASEEGEGDRSLDFWREAHRRFFTRTLPLVGREFSEDMPLVCERFRVIYPELKM